MNQYLLLRDNKQTGPYTAEQLAAKGIKPYDLVWQEGRSAAWRYPSEIEELKPFAPVVEEQPYDRFFKKPGEQTAGVSAVASQTTTEHQQPVVAAGNTASEVQESQPVSKLAEQTAGKHIYVTMPASKTQTNVSTTPVTQKEETAKPVAQQNNQPAASTTNKTAEKKTAAASYLVSQEDDEQNSGLLKGYQSRKKEDDEINNSFLNEYESKKAAFLAQKKSGGSTIVKETEKPVAKKEIWSSPKKDRIDLKALLAGSGKYLQDNKNLTRGLVAAVLILGGVVIGLVINSGRRQPDTQVLESLVKEIREQQSEKISTTAPTTETAQKDNETRQEENYSSEQPSNNITDPAPQNAVPPANNSTTNQAMLRPGVIKKDNNIVPPPQNQQNKSIAVQASNTNTQPVEATPAVMETKEKPINHEVLEKARKNIYDQVHVEASGFKVGLLGGISDLDLTILNGSLYALDQVSVEIKYFGPEKKLVKTQTLIFNSVPPGKRRTLEAPRTNRGITIDYTITSINSKALGLAQTGF